MNKIIDQLPNLRPQFKRGTVTAQGQTFELYFRNVLQYIRALYGHAEFAQYLVFAPERHYSDADHTMRIYHEMHTAKWWWETQKQLEKDKAGATIIPIIIAT